MGVRNRGLGKSESSLLPVPGTFAPRNFTPQPSCFHLCTPTFPLSSSSPSGRHALSSYLGPLPAPPGLAPSPLPSFLTSLPDFLAPDFSALDFSRFALLNSSFSMSQPYPCRPSWILMCSHMPIVYLLLDLPPPRPSPFACSSTLPPLSPGLLALSLPCLNVFAFLHPCRPLLWYIITEALHVVAWAALIAMGAKRQVRGKSLN